MEILDLAVSLRDSLPDSGRACQHTVWWCGCGDVDVGCRYVGGVDVGGVDVWVQVCVGCVDVLGCGCGGAGMCVRCMDVCGWCWGMWVCLM